MVRIKKPHKTNYFGGQLPDFRPLALYKHKDLTVHTEGADDFIYDEMAERQAGRPMVGNRCLQYASGATITFSSITGTLWCLTKVAGVWAWRDMSSLLSGLVLTMDAAHTHYGAFKDDVWFANCEDGFGDLLRSNAPTAFGTLSTEDVRDTQNDKPMLSLSGDVVGWGFEKAIDMQSLLVDYFDGTPESLPYTPITAANGAYQFYTIISVLSQFRVTHRCSTLLGDNTSKYEVGGLEQGFFSDGNGVFCRTFSNELKRQDSIITISHFGGVTGGTIANGQFTFNYVTNNPLLIVVWSYVFKDAVYALASSVDVVDDPNNHLTFVSDHLFFDDLYDFMTDPAATQSVKDNFDEIFLTYSNQDVLTYYANTIDKNRLDLNLRYEYSFIIEVDSNNRNIYSKLSSAEFTNQSIYSFVNNRTSAVSGMPLPPVSTITIATSPTYNIPEYGGNGDDIELMFYFGDIRSRIITPKNISSNLDVNGEKLIYNSPRDWPAKVTESGALDLAYEFWDRPAEWDDYIPGITETDTVLERDNSGSVDRICVFNEAPTGEQLTRAQRFTKDKV